MGTCVLKYGNRCTCTEMCAEMHVGTGVYVEMWSGP